MVSMPVAGSLDARGVKAKYNKIEHLRHFQAIHA